VRAREALPAGEAASGAAMVRGTRGLERGGPRGRGPTRALILVSR